MTSEGALKKVEAYLTAYLPIKKADEIDEILSALKQELMRPKGKWMYDIDSPEWSFDFPYKCSNCGTRFVKSSFCPICGAKMESENKE